jgi:geranylgeranyl pyrophosphate synthase
LHALHEGPDRAELQRLLAHGAPDGEMLDRALEIVRRGSIDHARAAVSAEVARADALARQLPDGTARHALIQLARFLAVRCGADPGDDVS